VVSRLNVLESQLVQDLLLQIAQYAAGEHIATADDGTRSTSDFAPEGRNVIDDIVRFQGNALNAQMTAAAIIGPPPGDGPYRKWSVRITSWNIVRARGIRRALTNLNLEGTQV
jgi:hypothetical protein